MISTNSNSASTDTPVLPKLLSGLGGLKMRSDEIPDVEETDAEEHHHQEENINIRAAVVHVIGDML